MVSKFWLLLAFIFCLAIKSSAQHIHLSQFYNNAHLLNPAQIGDHEGDFSVTANHRGQWREISAPINTSVFAFGYRIHVKSHQLQVGVLVSHDEFSGFDMIDNKFLFSGAYAFQKNGHQIRFGLQTGMASLSSNYGLQTFPQQWEYGTGTFNTSLNSGELLRENAAYWDVNSGLQWSKQYGKFIPKVGFALHHINRPKGPFFKDLDSRIRQRSVMYFNLDFQILPNLWLKPSVMSMFTSRVNQMVLGGRLYYENRNSGFSGLWLGTFYRHGINRNQDALIPGFGFGVNQFNFEFTYDFNTSQLSAIGVPKSTYEFSIIYVAKNSKNQFITNPCERF